MIIPSRYRLTKEIKDLINELNELKNSLDQLQLNPEEEKRLRRIGMLKSALYSARIEGNPLTENDFPELRDSNIENHLLPRRHEVLNIIRDHRQVSFDFLRRRFPVISGRLLRYDLKKLQDANLIKKLGVTRGAVYETAQT
jgi:DNA-binding HxlR family transcriptional regulator